MKTLRNLSAVCLLALSGNVMAADDDVPHYADDTLTGDWGGKRSAWFNEGIALEGTYKIDYLNNLRGGIGKGSRSMTNLDLKMHADLDKLWGLAGTTAYVHVLDNRGSGINADKIGSQMGATNIEVPLPTARIFHAWVEKSFLDEQWALLAGLYPIDSEFSVVDSAGVFLHPAYGASQDLSQTRGPSIFNNSAFGLRLKWQSEDKSLYAMGAVLDGIPGDPDRPKRTAIRFNKGDGSFSIVEIGWKPLESGHLFEPSGPERVLQTPETKAHEKYEGYSKYAAGLWRYSNRAEDVFDLDTAGNPLQRFSWGGHLLAERSLFSFGGDSARHLTGFFRYTFADGNSTAIESQINLGINVRGLFANRSDDVFGLAWSEGRLGSKYRRAQLRDSGSDTAHAEHAVELTYRASLTPWLAIQPNLQWISHPGGAATAPRATVAGFRLELQL